MTFATVVFERSRAVLVALVALLVMGVIAFNEMPVEAEPEIDDPILNVTLEQTGIRPEDADRLLVRPVARQLRSVAGVKELRSAAYAGGASISLEFETPIIFGTRFDAERALALVRERLDLAAVDLPAEAKKAKLQQQKPSIVPLLVVTLAGAVPQSEQLRHARALRDKLRALPAIADADIAADREEMVEVTIDPLILSSYGLDAETLFNAVTRANRPGASGGVDSGQGRLDLSVAGLFASTSDILELPVKASTASVVRLRDVAAVRTTLRDRRVISRLNGHPATAIEIRKRAGADVTATIETIREAVDTASKSWPDGLRAAILQDRSWRIRARISELRNALISAVIVVMSIIIATLGFRSGLLIGVAIPGSLLIAVLGLAALGVSINTAVLFAFVMSIGLLVDGAIVIVENADRLIARGCAPRDAFLRSVQHMRSPVICSIATTLAAFLPLLFWPGAVGEYMKLFPLTMLLTLSAAAVMALIFIPVLGAVMGRNRAPPRGDGAVSARRSRVNAEYGVLLGWTLAHPGWAVSIALATLVWSVWMYANYGRNVELLPSIEPSGALVIVRTPGDLSLEQKRDLALEVEDIVLGFAAFESVFARIGSVTGAGAGARAGVIAEFLLEFRDWRQHAHGDRVLADLEQRLAGVSGVSTEVRAQRDGPGGEKPIRLDVTATSNSALNSAVSYVRNSMQSIRGIKGIEDSRPPPGIEWQLQIDRAQAARFGVDIAKIEQYVRFVTRGVVLGALESAPPDDGTQTSGAFTDQAIDIVMRFPSHYRSVEGLHTIRVQTERGSVPLDHFATLIPVPRGGAIERVEGQLARSVIADVEPGVLESDLVRDIRAQLPSSALPAGAEVRIRGEDEDRDDAREFLVHAFIAAIVVMAAILVAQFNSFYSALVILFAIILSSIGVRLGLLLIDMPYGIVMSGIGVVALVSIVVNNNVILIDTYARLRRDGHDARNALLLAGEIRLRPILLTAVTTVAGLLPMMIGIDIDFVERTAAFGAPGAQYWTQMSCAVAFGLSFATLFTLFVTPAALMIRDNVMRARTRAHALGTDESIQSAFDLHGPVIGLAAFTAIVAAWVFVPQITAMRLIDIFAKQIFEQAPSSWFQALESTGFYCLIMLGAAYAYWRNEHVRVDIIRERVSARAKATIEIIGFVVLLAPVSIAVLVPGFEIVFDSIRKEEASAALLGTPTLWVFKAIMLLCYLQLLAIGAYVTWKNVRFLRGRESHPYPPERTLRDAYEDDLAR